MRRNKTDELIQAITKAVGYRFGNLRLLDQALTHTSFGNENRTEKSGSKVTTDNERLEFLGDAILDFIVSQLLIERFPEADEGDLSKRRAALVNEHFLAVLAREVGLGEYLKLGKGEERTGGRDKESILSSALEALVAAIYLDGGFDEVSGWTRKLFEKQPELLDTGVLTQDYKTRLQEVLQGRYKGAPKYEVVESTGPDHDKTFVVRILFKQATLAQASGKSKKEAEQEAARQVFEKYGGRVDL